jgi:DnaJ-class molecular chaperone
VDPFETLGLERRWDLGEARIREAQRRAAARWHPDRFRDPAERDAAQRRVAQVNEAATRLLDPLERGRAMLDAFAPPSRPTEPRPSPAFLSEMLGLHEGLASSEAGMQAEARARMAELRADAEVEAKARFAQLATGDASAWLSAASALATLRATVRAMEGWSA